MRAAVFQRDFSGAPVNLGGCGVTVESFAWDAAGGPASAQLRATGNPAALARLLNVLRCPVEIRADNGELRWWGYVLDVTIGGAVEYGVSLAGMFNCVRVAYSYVAEGSSNVGERRTHPDTPPSGGQQHAQSTSMYGRKDALVSIGGATTTAAEAAAARLLASFATPQASIVQGEPGAPTAVLTCAGWWSTLEWRYYANSGTDAVATTDQLADIVTDAEFLTSADIWDASGITSSEYRDGDQTAGTIAGDLLAQGTNNNLPLWAHVTPERRVRIYQEPAPDTARYGLGADGRLYAPAGGPLPADYPLVTEWVRLQNASPIYADLAGLVDIAQRFIVRWEWRAGRAFPSLTFRGQPKPFEIASTINA